MICLFPLKKNSNKRRCSTRFTINSSLSESDYIAKQKEIADDKITPYTKEEIILPIFITIYPHKLAWKYSCCGPKRGPQP